MSQPPPPPLDYADRILQRGVITEPLDGGVRITIPQQGGTSLFNRIVSNTPLRKSQLTPRAVLEVAAGKLTIHETDSEGHQHNRSWEADELTECRPNRYQRSLYLRVPGKEVWDALGELDEELIRFVADTLRPYLPNVPPPG